MITFADFRNMELVVGQVKEAVEHPNADKLLVLKVEVGGREKQLVAGIRGHYTPEELIGKTIIVVDNLEPATLRGEKSEGMLLAASDADGRVILLTTEKDTAPGSKVS